MKNSKLIQLTGMLYIAILSACAPSYFGKSYSQTHSVDVYLDAADIKQPHITIGNSTFDKGNKSQQKIIDMGKANGADGVIMKVTEEVASTQRTGTGVITKRTKNDIFTSSSSTMDLKAEKIKATFIKYE